NRARPLLPILFWNVDPAQWLCSICFILQPSMQLLDFLLCLLLVVHIRDAVHPGAGVPSQHQECLLQRFWCAKVSDREEFTSWICLRQFSYSTESHLTYFPSSMSRVCGAPSIRLPVRPFPPVGTVAAPFRGALRFAPFNGVESEEVELSPCLRPLAQTARAVFPQAAF